MKKPAQNEIIDRRHKSENKSLRLESSKLLSIIYCILSSKTGFTLIELIVGIAILATLIIGGIATLNPARQIDKAQDSKRQQNLAQIKNALDVYYQDNNCYPASSSTFVTALSNGSEWKEGNTVYMKKVPQDAKCVNGGGSCYSYKIDTATSCPQWNVLFAQLTKASVLTNTCPLSSLSSCTPSGYSDGFWACTLSGAVNCSNLAAASLLAGNAPTYTPAPTSTPGPTATPTPAPTPPVGSVTYNIGAPANTNPYPYQATVMPLYQTIGKVQSIEVLANDTVGNIISMKVVLYSDGDARQFTLTKVAGLANNGTWGGQSQPWQVTDTYNKFYGYDIIATDDKNNTYTAGIRVKN